MSDPNMTMSGNAESMIRDAPMMRGTRGKLDVAATLAVGNSNFVVPLQQALPTTDYSPQVTLESDATILGSIDAVVLKGSRQAGQVTVTLRNTLLVTLAVNLTIHVLAAY